jgi:hypothetical protein
MVCSANPISYVRLAADALCLGDRTPSVPSHPPTDLCKCHALQVRIIDVRFLPRAINIGPSISVEKPSWRIQGERSSITCTQAWSCACAGGFEFVLAGISISDPDANNDGGLITAKLTTTRGWFDFFAVSLFHLTARDAVVPCQVVAAKCMAVDFVERCNWYQGCFHPHLPIHVFQYGQYYWAGLTHFACIV